MAGPLNSNLVGRSSQIDQINGALDSVAQGQERVLLLAGEPGIGKSTLIDAAVHLAIDRSFTAISTRCPEQEGAPPFWPWTLALNQIAGAYPAAITDLPSRSRATLASIAAPLALDNNTGKPSGSQFELFVVVVDLIRSISVEKPIILTIDDLHWADSSSLKLLEHATDNLSDSPVLFICAMRDTEFDIGNDLSSTLATLTRHRYTTRLPLGRLDQAASNAILAGSIGSTVSTGLSDNIFSYAEGNPFYTLELARLHQQTNPGGESGTQAVPAGVRDVISQRLRLLTTETLDALKQASLFGREFDIRLLAGATGRSPLDTLSLLEPAENMDVAAPIEPGPLFRFKHVLFREVLVASLGLSERVRLHAKAAEAIEASDAHPNEEHADELAHHYKGAETLTGPGPVVKYLVMAGHTAISRLAFDEAARFFLDAEELHGSAKRDHVAAEIKEWSGVAIAANEDLEHGHKRVWDAFDIYEGLGDITSALRTAIHPVPLPFAHVRNDQIKRAIKLAEPDSLELAELLSRYSNRVGVGYSGDNWDEATSAFSESIRICKLHGDDDSLFWALGRYILVGIDNGHLNQVAGAIAEARLFAPSSSDWEAVNHFYMWSSKYHWMTGELERAREDAQLSIDAAKRSGRKFRLLMSERGVRDCLWLSGEFRRLINRYSEPPMLGEPEFEGLKAMAALALGEYQEYETYRSTTFDSSGTQGFRRFVETEFELEKHLLTGEVPAELSVSREESLAVNLPRVGVTNLELAIGIGAVFSGNNELAHAQYRLMKEKLGDHRSSFFGPAYVPRTLLGKIAAGAGLIDEAAADFTTAVRWCREHKYPVDLVVALAESAEFASAHNRQVDGMDPAQLAVEGQVAADSISMVSRNPTFDKYTGPSTGAPGHPDGLTAREVEVLKELAAGKSNREIAETLFISQNTVIRHVANIFSKTGSANRAQAAVYATALDLQ